MWLNGEWNLPVRSVRNSLFPTIDMEYSEGEPVGPPVPPLWMHRNAQTALMMWRHFHQD